MVPVLRSLLRSLAPRRYRLPVVIAGVATLLACDAQRFTGPKPEGSAETPTEPTPQPTPPPTGPDFSLSAGGTDVYVVAHHEDWQVFFGDRVATSLQGTRKGNKVVFVYTTASDAGFFAELPAYWQAKEEAAKASMNLLAGAGAWTCANQTVNAHAILRCTKGSVVSYFLRLPEGNGEGEGFGFGSMQLLRDQAQTVASAGGATSYPTWSNLAETVRALVDLEAGGSTAANVEVHTTEWTRNLNEGDGPDHLATGDLVSAAAAGRSWNLSWYVGDPTLHRPVNLSQADRDIKWSAVVAYDAVMMNRMGETMLGNSYAEVWVWRTYARNEIRSDTSSAPAPVPLAPSSLVAQAIDTARIDLTWTDNSSDETGFRVERAPDVANSAGTFTEIGAVAANTTSFSSTGLASGTRYWYRVRAYSAAGNSAYSQATLATTPAPPGAPTALLAQAIDTSRIDLSWTDNSTTEASFAIERAPDVAGVAGTFAEIGSVASDVTTYSSTGLSTGTRYWYRVRAVSTSGSSGYSNPASGTTLAPPGAPGALAAQAIDTVRIDLSWTDNSTGETGFRIERAPDVAGTAGAFTEIGTVGNNVTTFSSTGLSGGTVYWYRVRAYSAAGNSAYSPQVSATTLTPPPAAPSALAAQAIDVSRIDLSWTDNSTTEQGFGVERAPDVAGVAGTFTEIGTVGSSVTTYSNTGLSSSTPYWYRVRAYSAAGNSAYTAQVSATTLTPPPGAPTALQAQAVDVSRIDLSWTDNSTTEESFHIERAPDVSGSAGAFTEIGTVASNVTTYSNTGLSSGTAYWYRVRASSSAGNSAYSGQVSATTLTPPPAAPTALQAQAVDVTRIDLSWTDNSTTEESFRIERAPDVSGAPGAFAEIGTVGSNVTTYSNTGLSGATAYWYRVRASSSAGNSAYSGQVSATTLTPPPAAPSALVAQAIDESRIDLSWADNSTTEESFRIERAPDVSGSAGAFTEIGTVASNVTTYSSTGLSGATAYWYRVRASSSAGNSAYTAQVSATTLTPPPAAPSALAAQAIDESRIDLSWTDNSTAEESFRIERAPDVSGAPGAFAEIGTVGSNVTTYSSTGLSGGTVYWYRVRASSSAGNSAYTGQVSATTLTPPPAAPSALVAQAIDESRIDLSWTDNSTTEESFHIERAPDVAGTAGAFTEIGTVGSNVTTYSSTGLSAATAYWYRVRASSSAGNSAYTGQVSATTLTPPPAAPSALAAQAIDESRIDLSWTDNSTTEESFHIERAPDVSGAPGAFAEIGTVASNVTTYSSTGLSGATAYWYRVRASSSAGNSAYTGQVSATTLTPPPAAPSALAAQAIDESRIDLSWADNSTTEESFHIERAPDVSGAAGAFAEIGTVGSNVTTYSNTGLTSGSAYWYRVRASSAAGNSAYSTQASATTLTPVVLPPAAPSALAALAVDAATIELSWSDNSTTEDGFHVERAPDATGAPGSYTQIATVGQNATAYLSTGLAAGTRYWYRVRAYSVEGTSGYTSGVSATTPPLPPAPPSSLAAQPVDTARIDLSWVDNSLTEDGFRIERAPDVSGVPGAFAEIAAVGTNVTTYGDTGLSSGTSYWYRVRAYSAVGGSPYSAQASAATLTPPPPAAPSALAATPIDTASVGLSWTDNATSEDGFRVERAPDVSGAAGTFVEIGTVAGDVTTYTDSGLASSTRYWYRVRAYSAAGSSAYSSASSALTPAPPPTPPAAPSGLAASASDSSRIDLTWVDNSTTETGFRVERAPDVSGAPGTFVEIGTVAANLTTYASTGLSSDTRYWYRVRAYSAAGNSAYSTQASATTLPPPPPPTSGRVDLYVFAHQDDWQLFLGNHTAVSAQTAGKVVLVYTTAGNSSFPRSYPAYWQAREAAANASVNTLSGSGPWSCGTQTVNGHPIARCVSGKVINYYMRLPDGAGDGGGSGDGSLAILRDTGTPLTAMDGSTTYGSWGDAVSTLRAIIDFETAGAATIEMHAPETDLSTNEGDHSDHLTTGEMVRAAAPGRTWNLTWYLGYPVINLPANVTTADRNTKWAQVVAYDEVMVDLMGETIIGTSHAEEWVWRTYSRTENAGGLPTTPPAAPSGLQAQASTSTRINLTWVDNTNIESEYRVERAPDVGGAPGTFAQIASLGANTTAYSSTGLTSGTRYWYRVRAANLVGPSPYSGTASATTLSVPTAPTALQASALSAAAIELTWTDNSSNETGFRVERAPDVGGAPGTFAQIATVTAGVTTYRATGLTATTRYWFRVRAYNGAGTSGYSGQANATTLALVPPSALTATTYYTGNTRNVDLRWTVGSELTVDIYRNGTRIVSGRVNDGGPHNNRPSSSLGSSITYQVCAAGKTGAANCTAVVTANF